MSQYLLSVWHDDNYEVDFDDEEMQRVVAQVGAFNNELQDAGVWVFAGGLHSADSATVVRDKGGEVSDPREYQPAEIAEHRVKLSLTYSVAGEARM